MHNLGNPSFLVATSRVDSRNSAVQYSYVKWRNHCNIVWHNT